MTDPRPTSSASSDPAAGLFREAADHAREQAATPHGLPSLSELQALFPEYELEGLIGRGGMGAVYRAHDPKLHRFIAIKILPPHLSADPSFAERFAREARALARLQHPHILTVHDYGEREGLPYLITEFVDGVDLRRLITTERISAVESLRIVPQICDALQVAHEHGVVHRDVKPENILIDTRGHVRVADFGLAKMLGQETGPGLTATDQTLGTAHYAAPETFRGLPVDHRADIFSLGVLFYELLTGQLPVGHFRPPSERAGTEPRLDEIVSRALRDEPAERYQSIAEVRRDLDSEQGPKKEAPRKTPRTRSPAPRVTAGHRFATERAAHRSSPWHWIFFALLFMPLITMGLMMLASGIHAITDSISGPVVEAGGVESSPPRFALAGILVIGFAAVWLVFVVSGFRKIGRLRRGEIDASPSLLVLRAWLQLLIPINFVILAFLPQLDDRDSQTIFEAGVAAFLVLLDLALIIWQSHTVRAELARRAS